MMTEYILLPELGEGINEGKVISIAVAAGDNVDQGQTLFEIETDKVTMEIPADYAGTITAIHIDEGQSVTPGMQMLSISTAAANEEDTSEPSNDNTPTEKQTEATESHIIFIPDLGEGITEGKIVNQLFSAGDAVTKGDTLVEVETEKVVLEIPADCDGTISQWIANTGDTVSSGSKLVELQTISVTENKAETTTQAKPLPVENIKTNDTNIEKTTPSNPVTTHTTGELIPSAPSARRLAREIGIDIRQVSGSGKRGRISKEDVKAYAKQQNQLRSGSTSTIGAANKALPDIAAFGPVRREAMTSIEKTTADNMDYAWSQIPHAWLQEKINITALEASRQKHKARIKSAGGSLTITAILVKAVARALQAHPRFNAALDNSSNELVYRDYYHIGVAVDTPAGLVVPKVENADEKNLTDISIALSDLSVKARERKLMPKDLSGAGFTISNLGGIGVSGIFPIVNWPQVAILGVAASQTEVQLIDGELKSYLMMPVTLGFDHRVINGADGARFLQYLKKLLEDPFNILL